MKTSSAVISGQGANAQELSVARGSGLAFAVALAATLVMAAPVVMAPSERLFGNGETFAREDPNRDPFIVIEQFRTGQVPLPYLQPLTDLPGRALGWLLGPVAAYNVVILATFPLSAAAAYLLSRYLLGSHPGAMVAGLVYAFLPFHVAHASNHPHVSQTQWLPLYFLALWRCLDHPDLRRSMFLFAAAAAVALSNFYGGFIAAVLSPVALVAYAVVSPRGPAEGRFGRLALTAFTLSAASAAAFVLIYKLAPTILLRPGAFAFPRSDLFLHSARWWSYFVPPVDHPLFGPEVRELWAGSAVQEALLEQQVGVGWSILVLSTVPLWLWLRGDRTSLAVRNAPVLATIALAALLCSLSPERTIGSFTFVRPSALLYELAPMFRAYARFGVVVGLMTALLSGEGAALLWRSPTSAGRRAVALLLSLAFLEYAPFPPWRFRDVLPTRAHRWISAQPGSLRVLDCVPPTRLSDVLALPLLGHEVSLLGTPPLDDCGEPHLGEKLQALGYTHAVVRRGSPIGGWLAKNLWPFEGPVAQPPRDVSPRGSSAGIHWRRSLPDDGFARGSDFEDGWILRVNAMRPRVYVRALFDFYAREYAADATWRWMARKGAMGITATGETVRTVLELELKAFPDDRYVDWSIDGKRLGEIKVTGDWGRYELPLGKLAPGEIALTLSCREPAIVANDVLHNGDARALGLAVGNWRIRENEE